MKCDEIKPICGPCAKKDKLCEYTSAVRHSVNVPASDGATTGAAPSPTTQKTTSPGQDGVPASTAAIPDTSPDELHESPDLAWTAPDADVNPHAQDLLDHLPGSDLASNQSPIAWQQSYLSPSNASFAAVRWFGLLASDAARDSPQLSTFPPSGANESLSLDHSGGDGLAQISSLQRATQVLDSPTATHTSHDPTDAGATGGSTLGEEQIWQSREPVELLPTEQTLFEHFVHRVCPWVGHRPGLCGLDILA